MRATSQHSASRQGTAFKAEVAHWSQSEPSPASRAADEPRIPAHEVTIRDGYQVFAQMHGSVWRVLVEPGERVEVRQVLLIIEAMKMEVEVLAPVAGVIKSTRCKAGQTVSAGDILAVIQ